MGRLPTQNVPTEAELLRRQRSAAGRKGQKRTPEQKARIQAGAKKGWVGRADKSQPKSPETRKRISEGLVRAYKDGRIDPAGCYKNKWQTYKGINMRSKSEMLFAQHLDEIGVAWEYEPQRFDLGWGTYTPDFYLPDFDHWVEVKGYWTETSRRKFDEFRQIRSASAVMAREILKGDIAWSLA